MKLFVTGGTGFIGSHFLSAALNSGHKIVALRRSAESRPRVTVEESDLLVWLDKGMPDVESKDMEGCDALVHLAAHSANVPYDTLENCIYWNVLVPLALFRKAVEAGVGRFVVAGSCFEYGRSGERYEFIPPDAPLEPTQTYPASKAAASIAFSQFAVQSGVKLSIHRIFQVFGEGEAESRFWPSLRKAALSGENFAMTKGEQIRDFVPVEEVARQFMDAVLREVASGKPLILNLGTGRPQTLRQFAEEWWLRWKARGQLQFGVTPYREGEVMRYVPLISSL